jgi:hypothetical protein
MMNESDEAVVAKFVANPYWQYFCGLEHFTTTKVIYNFVVFSLLGAIVIETLSLTI